MQKTKIEWVKNPDGSQGYSWNPIKGKCPAGCKLPDGRIYCYGHTLYDGRLKRYDPGEPKFDDKAWRRGYLKLSRARKSLGVFLCSTFDLFHPITTSKHHKRVRLSWRDELFADIEMLPRHHFYILTKFPQNIDRPMPPNVWLGVSVTKSSDLWRLRYLEDAKASLKFISIEPMLELPESCGFHFSRHPDSIREDISLIGELESGAFDWIIVGRLTRFGHKHDPDLIDIKQIVGSAREYNVPIFLKNNLSGIWPGELIQEGPG